MGNRSLAIGRSAASEMTARFVEADRARLRYLVMAAICVLGACDREGTPVAPRHPDSTAPGSGLIAGVARGPTAVRGVAVRLGNGLSAYELHSAGLRFTPKSVPGPAIDAAISPGQRATANLVPDVEYDVSPTTIGATLRTDLGKFPNPTPVGTVVRFRPGEVLVRPSSVVVKEETGVRDLEFRLDRAEGGSSIAIRLSDDAGSRIVGARVAVHGPDASEQCTDLLGAPVSDENGEAMIRSLRAGRYRVTLLDAGESYARQIVREDGQAAIAAFVRVPESQLEPVTTTLRASRAAELRVRVRPRAEWMPGRVGVSLLRRDDDGAWRAIGDVPDRTDVGMYRFSRLARATYQVVLRAEDCLPSTCMVDLSKSSSESVSLVPGDAGLSVRLRFRANDASLLEGETFMLARCDGGEGVELVSGSLTGGPVVERETGHVLSLGRYLLRLQRCKRARVIDLSAAPQGRELELLIPERKDFGVGTGRVSVVVRAGRQEVRKLLVALRRGESREDADGSDWMWWEETYPGAAEFPGVPAGRYTVVFFDAVTGVRLSVEGGHASRDIQVEEGQLSRVEFDLPP